MISEAGISSCKKFRWWLYRCWDPRLPLVIWVMMNPSTADHQKNDPTINKIISYSKRWGYGGILVINIYAIRSTDSSKIKGRIGYRNDWWLSTIFKFAKRKKLKVVCAWGVKHKDRGDEVRNIAAVARLKLWCLRSSKNGEPCHPLYLPGDLVPQPFLPLSFSPSISSSRE
jgi:hypothetical protein